MNLLLMYVRVKIIFLHDIVNYDTFASRAIFEAGSLENNERTSETH